jgi:hypothetical protein
MSPLVVTWLFYLRKGGEKMGKIFLLIILLFCINSFANAAVIYDESIDGDIETWENPPVFELSLGLNSVLGSSSWSIPGPPFPTADADVFGFIVPHNSQLDEITFEYNVTSVFGDVRSIGLRYAINMTGEDGTWDKTCSIAATEEVVFIFDDGSNPNTVTSPSPVSLLMRDVINCDSATGPIALPLSEGLYWFVDGKNMSGTEDLGSYGGDWEYNLTFAVSPIPPELVSIDIIPKTCPNECPIKGGGSIEVAIHGTADFDVTNIDIASIRLEGVAPTRSSLKDKSTPVISPSDVCDCTTEKRDGFIDLCLKFDKKEILNELGEVNIGDSFVLTLTGNLKNDGTPIEGQDCMNIVKKGGKGKKD